MATRRIKSTVNNRYTQPLKLRLRRKIVIAPGCDYVSILLSQKYRPTSPFDIKANVWAKFNTQTFDGIQLVAWLSDPSFEETSSSSCTFNIYYVSAANNWAATMIATLPGTASGQKWTATCDQATLGSANELSGERTLLVESVLTRFTDTYKTRAYVNHLGIYDSLIRLKNDLEFVKVTKMDV